MSDRSGQLRPFDRSLPMALMRARESVMSGFRPSFAAHGVTEQQWRVLRALDATEGATSVGQLGSATYLLGPSLSRMVASLHERGLLRRSTSDGDARRADVEITDAGRTLVETIAPASEAWYAHIESQLGEQDLDTLYDLLDRVADLMTDTAATA